MALSKEGDPQGPKDPFKTYVKIGKIHGYKSEFTGVLLQLSSYFIQENHLTSAKVNTE